MLENGYRPEGSKFSEDITDKVYASGTVTYTSIQFACYMGFSELYLLGFDHNYSLTRQEDGSFETKDVENYSGNLKEFNSVLESSPDEFVELYRMNAAYTSALRYCRDHGVGIYNATRGGHLEFFERVDFDRLFSWLL